MRNCGIMKDLLRKKIRNPSSPRLSPLHSKSWKTSQSHQMVSKWERLLHSQSHFFADQSSSVSLSSTSSPPFTWPFISLSPPQNAFSDHLRSTLFRALSFLTRPLTGNTNMPFPPPVPHAIPLFISQVNKQKQGKQNIHS